MIDITGKKFARLTVVGRDKSKSGRKTYWLCKCECGNEASVESYSLRNGKIKSCGCYRKTFLKNVKKTHGESRTTLYKKWSAIKERCYNPNCERYANYGGRSIKICDEWLHDFVAFKNWAIAAGYKEGLSIERNDINGDYCPENCSWITLQQQATNKTNSVFIEIDGQTKCIAEWGRFFNLSNNNIKTAYKRHKKGMTGRQIFNF